MLARTARRPSFIIPAPSRRAATRALVAAAVILIFQTVWWLPQPCDTDVACAPIIGVLTGAALVPIVLALIVWHVAGRASPVVIVATVIVALTAPILPSLFIGSSGNLIALLMGLVPLLLAFAAVGALPDLRPHVTERAFAIAVLVLVAGWFVTLGLVLLTIVPILVGVAIAASLFGRPRHAVAAPTEDDEVDGDAAGDADAALADDA